MVNLTRISLLIIFMFWTTGSTGTAFSIEEEILQLKFKVTQLEAKDVQMEGKNAKMQEKVTELESKNVEMQEEIIELKLKDVQMEEKVTQLETKVKEQENILTLLKSAELQTSIGSKSNLNKLENAIQSTGRSGTPRTCRELRVTDPSLPSGMQWIDPDGQGVGDSPISVYCDMATGSTSILHNSELPIDVGHCADPGCYSRAINYNASMKQIESLIALSSECHQQIKYDCYYAPFQFDNIQYAWWNDRNGNAQYFWAGNNTNGIHTCQCGIGGNCVDPAVKCNCDVAAPVQLVDDGVITDKNVLPVTRLNFGRTQLATSSGIHTLGRFQCTGSVALTGFPTSCEDLWLIGHTLNGFYDVMGSTMMESIYCDFTKLPSDAEFEKWIGYADVKSAPVHFYVQRNSSFNTTSTPILYQLAVVNDGNAMDLATGKFTAPRNGIYFFSFTGMAKFPASTSLVGLWVLLYLNGGQIGIGEVDEANTGANQLSPLILQSTLNLKKGDQVWLQMSVTTSSGVILFDNGNHFTHFTGFMLEEEIVASLL